MIEQLSSYKPLLFVQRDQTIIRNSHQAGTGFWKESPLEGTEVMSWYVMMGIGRVVTLRVPAEKLREVNLVIEKRAWGAYRSEFYASYDFQPVWESNYQKK
jgi:ABC-type tungstate transport system permease subunit